jgi:polar amino acid transport system permease protein
VLDLIETFFRGLNEQAGINLTILYDPFDRARFWSGFLMTIWLAVTSVVASIAIGVAGAAAQTSRIGPLRWFVDGYVAFFRNTPPLVQMYFFFFGLGSITPSVPDDMGFPVPLIGNVTWAIVALSLFAGAFNVEIFRSGLEAVPKGMTEAATALGLPRFAIYQLVTLPLAFRICLPALNNNLVNLIKTTTLAYAIGVPEMLYVSNQIWSDTLNVPEMMTVLLVLYIILVTLLVWAMHRWEKAMRLPGFGRR